MTQHPVEIILTRQLAEYLSTPVFVVDPDGTLVFFNEAAEVLLGRRYEESGEITVDEMATLFRMTSIDDGSTISGDSLPIAIALRKLRPSHRRFRIVGLDGVARTIESTALPLVGQGGRLLGAVNYFWELDRQ